MEEVNDRGIYPKYVVFKHPKVEFDHLVAKSIKESDGFSMKQEQYLDQVEDFVFVLKPLKDPAARVAMAAYAEAIYEEKPQLAQDMWEILGDFHGH